MTTYERLAIIKNTAFLRMRRFFALQRRSTCFVSESYYPTKQSYLFYLVVDKTGRRVDSDTGSQQHVRSYPLIRGTNRWNLSVDGEVADRPTVPSQGALSACVGQQIDALRKNWPLHPCTTYKNRPGALVKRSYQIGARFSRSTFFFLPQAEILSSFGTNAGSDWNLASELFSGLLVLAIFLYVIYFVAFYLTQASESTRPTEATNWSDQSTELEATIGTNQPTLLGSSSVPGLSFKSALDLLIMPVFAAVGLLFIILAQDLLMLYISIELYSISIYIWFGFAHGMQRHAIETETRTEPTTGSAGRRQVALGAEQVAAPWIDHALRYVLVSILASLFLIFSIVSIYGHFGTVNYEELRLLSSLGLSTNGQGVFSWGLELRPNVKLALFFFLGGLFIKMGLAPFQFWLITIYERLPWPLFVYVSLLAKISYFFVLWQFATIFALVAELTNFWFVFFLILGVLNIWTGSLLAIYQKSVRRFLFSSSLVSSGYILITLAAPTQWNFFALVLYLLIYICTMFAWFITLNLPALPWLTSKSSAAAPRLASVNYLSQLSQLSWVQKLPFLFIIFSLLGIPPLAGFYSKLFVLVILAKNQYFGFMLLLMLLSVLSGYYYLRLARVIFFHPHASHQDEAPMYPQGNMWIGRPQLADRRQVTTHSTTTSSTLISESKENQLTTSRGDLTIPQFFKNKLNNWKGMTTYALGVVFQPKVTQISRVRQLLVGLIYLVFGALIFVILSLCFFL